MNLGVRATAEKAVRPGLRNILFARRDEEQARAIDEYLKGLKLAPSPLLVNVELSAAAERGRRLFEDPAVGCAQYHPAPLFTDQKSYYVGTANRSDGAKRAFDTPTLVEVWRTAPYLHDGSAATLEDVLLVNRDDQHGNTSQLSP